MNVIRKIRKVKEGTISIDMPPALLHRKVEIIIIPLDEVSGGGGQKREKKWPAGFFDTTAGCFADDPIQRGLQGEYEIRNSVE